MTRECFHVLVFPNNCAPVQFSSSLFGFIFAGLVGWVFFFSNFLVLSYALMQHTSARCHHYLSFGPYEGVLIFC